MRNLAFLGALLAVAATWGPADDLAISNSIEGWRAKNWGLYNTEARSHVNAPQAWKLLSTKRKIVVAVIDTGTDSSHPGLKGNVAMGFNFVNDHEGGTVDDHGHGTHVSGIILAVSDFHATVIPIKYYSDSNSGSVNLRNTVKALNFAIDHEAKIINYSGGGPEPSEEEYLALKRAETKGILVVTAAGNEHQDTDIPENKYYPAAYRLSNMVSVAATDIHNNFLASSNWGKQRVDVTAPGDNIFSTLPGSRFGYMSGTSQATAFVTGVAAMMLSENPKLKAKDLKALIEKTVDRFPQQAKKTKTGGRVNAYAALKAAKSFTKVKE